MTKVLNTTGKDLFLGNKVSRIEDSFDKNEEYKVVVERYFTIRYVLQLRMLLDDYTVFFHSNRICVIALARSHSLIATNQTIMKIDFQVTEKINYLRSHAVGKSKRGAFYADKPESFLMYVGSGGKDVIGLCACIPGRVLEINKVLIEDPNLMIQDPWGKGYLAIIMPSPTDYEHYKNTMVKPEDVAAAKVAEVNPD